MLSLRPTNILSFALTLRIITVTAGGNKQTCGDCPNRMADCFMGSSHNQNPHNVYGSKVVLIWNLGL
jgi:hypothetical protein